MLDGYHMMIPGPITLDQRVLDEMALPIIPHYGPEWTKYYFETVELLKQVFDTTGKVFAIPGSGSAALDAAISSSMPVDGRLLVLSNGYFGDRIAEIARSHRQDTEVVQLPVDQPITREALVDVLDRTDNIKAVIVVHSESSSGMLNPVEQLGPVCQERGLLFLVDAISSLGGVEFSMKNMGIDVGICASQKCLEAPPGLGLVAVSEAGWQRIKGNETSGWYLNLQNWDRYADMWSEWHPYPITMAVPTFRALRIGLEAILAEGLDKRILRHRRMANYARTQLNSLGFRPVFDEAIASPTVIAVNGQAACSADGVVDRLKTEHRILIARGMGSFRGRAFRIGNMGPQATPEQMDFVLDAIADLIENTGEERKQ